jgi:glucose-1-phosphate adenylyltransferase
VVQEQTARGAYHLERGFIQEEFNRGTLSINVLPYEDKVLRIRTVAEYFENSLALTDGAVSNAIFRADRPIYTRVTDEVPSYYGLDCQVSGCILADGCIIEGRADHAVFSRGVRVGKGAIIKNCIIMQGSVVGEGAVLENVIVDKWATISAGTELKGAANAPLVIHKGVTV